jgi:hypothetical protein
MEALDRQEVTPIGVGAIRRERINLIRAVYPPQETCPVAAGRIAPNDDDIHIERCPLALDANELVPQIEDEVVSLTFRDRLQHPYAESDCGNRNLGLGDCTLLIRRQHRQRILVVKSDD